MIYYTKIIWITLALASFILIVILFPVKHGDYWVPLITHLVSDNRTECEKGNPDYELATGCPDYECTCSMPRNQSLCREVSEACIRQAQKLPGEQICVKKIGGMVVFGWG
jgi:hypothetical protein